MLPSGPPITDPWAPSSPTPKLPSTGVDPWGASVETSNTSGKWRAYGGRNLGTSLSLQSNYSETISQTHPYPFF